MKKVEFPGWSDESEKITVEIYRVVAQIQNIQKKSLTNDTIFVNENLQTFYGNIRKTLGYWTENTYVGQIKDKRVQKAFQAFFEALYDFLVFYKEIGNNIFYDLANGALYQGTVYRYLGHGSCNDNIYEKVEPEYNNIWVSWSKNSQNSYIESKLYGMKTILTCEVKKQYYGIDISAFGIAKGEEAEVVFPTIKELITSISYTE